MILAFDTYYFEDKAKTVCLVFENWTNSTHTTTYEDLLTGIEEYQSGEFYKRELPCILQLLRQHHLQPEVIVIDGYVYLDGVAKPGLGKHLYDALDGKSTIIGVAKNPFHGITQQSQLLRGKSSKPLYITSTGAVEHAKSGVAQMQGPDRLPLLLKRVDRLCRDAILCRDKPDRVLTPEANWSQP